MPVYFMQAMPGAPIKVGYSACPAARAQQIKCPLTGLHPRVLVELPDAQREDERAIHARFASRRLRVSAEGQYITGRTYSGRERHTRSEWFVPCPELLDLIAEHRA